MRRRAAPVKPIAAEPSTLREVSVALGERAYEILIGEGLLADGGAQISALAPGAQCGVVTDENVAALHLETAAAQSRRSRVRRPSVVVCPPGEATKSYAEFARVSDALIAARIERRDRRRSRWAAA